MHPILLDLGGFAIHSYGALSALGFLVVVFITLRRTRALGLATDHLVDVIFWSAIAGVIGARGLWVLQNLDVAPTWREWVNLRAGGLVFYGSLILGLPVALGVMRWRRLPLLPLADAFATALPFGHAIARAGCLAAGCCYGRPTSLPWGVTFSHPLTDAPHGVALHPTQAYEALLLVLIGAGTTWLYARRRFPGQIVLAYLGAYAVARFAVETVRGDASRGFLLEPWLGQALSLSQGVALAVLLGVAALWWALSRRAAA